jgi:phage RecT family recombinase
MTQGNKSVAVVNNLIEVSNILTSEKGIQALQQALGPDVDVKKYVRGVLTTIQTNTNGLEKCTPESVVRCVKDSAQLGLAVDRREHAFLIPRNNSNINALEATLQPGYKGYIFKLRKIEKIKSIWVEAVFKGDNFKITKGTSPEIIHEPSMDNSHMDKDITHFYTVVFFSNGSFEFECMTRAQVDEVRKTAKTQAIWSKNFHEMGRKTVLLRINKRLQFPETAAMVQMDSLIHEGKSPYIDGGQIFENKAKDYEDNENADTGMTPEKEKQISYINELFDVMGANNADKLKYMNRYILVPQLEYGKLKNLEMLGKVLNGVIETNQKEDSEA